MIWFLISAAVIVVLAALLWPLLRTQVPGPERAAYDLAVFQDQLKDIERDVARGVLTAGEAEGARVEIQRRMVAASKAPAMVLAADAPRSRKITAAALAVTVPALAIAAYLSVGAPTAPPITGAGDRNAEIARLVDQLAAKVAANPKDAEGLSLLARTYRELGRFQEAVPIFAQLVAVQPSADNYAGFGETLIAAASGNVSDPARDAFLKALNLDRNDVRSRFYLGLAQSQKGQPAVAIAIWRELSASAPADASWLPVVRQQMMQVAQDANIPPMTINPRHALDVFAADQSAPAASAPSAPPPAPGAAGLTPEQRQMVDGMVGGLAARLEQNQDDYDGWMMLGRSYTVLRKYDEAGQAYGKAMALKPNEPQPKLQYLTLMIAQNDPDMPLPDVMTKTAADILAIDANQPDALYVSGLARAKAGDSAGARSFWTKAQGALAEGAPLKGELARRLKTLQ